MEVFIQPCCTAVYDFACLRQISCLNKFLHAALQCSTTLPFNNSSGYSLVCFSTSDYSLAVPTNPPGGSGSGCSARNQTSYCTTPCNQRWSNIRLATRPESVTRDRRATYEG